MKVYFFFIFMVLHTITAEKALSKLRRKLFVPKIDDKCRKIKCPSVDEPECVRMKRNDLGINVHVIVVNKCELYYMQCHDNVEAKIVPMKYCSHNHGPVKKIMKDKSHSRVKRAVNEQDEKENESHEKSPFGHGYHPHPVKDPWLPDLYDKIPQELYIYLVMK